METSVFERVYAITRQIPEGKVATYGQIARLLLRPRGARMVGYAMAACHDPSVPCHRVVDRFGQTKSAFDTYSTGTQRALLEAEGVDFRKDGTVDLERCQWDGCLEADAAGNSEDEQDLEQKEHEASRQGFPVYFQSNEP